MANEFRPAFWMTDLGSVADSVQISQLPLPGSHDAIAYGTINEKSRTQGRNIKEQLESGFRYFDFRVRVDNGVFFGHHGSDEVRDNQYCPEDPKPPTGLPTVFADIASYSNDHPNEIIILNFYDASSVWGQSFNEDDRKNFIQHVADSFKDKLASPPASGGNIPTYGELKTAKTPIIALINDEGSWYLTGCFDKDYVKNHNVWLGSEWFADRFSDYKRLAGRTYEWLYEHTAQDQEDYLVGRSLNKIYVAQTILGYDNASSSDGRSANYWGAQAMNKLWMPTMQNWYHGKQWNGDSGKTVPKPNVLLLDYSGAFDDLPQVCSNLLKGI